MTNTTTHPHPQMTLPRGARVKVDDQWFATIVVPANGTRSVVVEMSRGTRQIVAIGRIAAA